MMRTKKTFVLSAMVQGRDTRLTLAVCIAHRLRKGKHTMTNLETEKKIDSLVCEIREQVKYEALKSFVRDLLVMEQLCLKDKERIFRSDGERSFWRAPFSWLKRKKIEAEAPEWKELAQKIAVFYSQMAEKMSQVDPEEILRIDLKKE